MNVDELKIDTQGRFLVVKGKIEDNAFIIANIYAPNRDRCSWQFFTNFQSHLLEFKINEDNTIIGGDFNCPLNPQLDKKGRILIPRADVINVIESLQTNFNLHDIWRIKNPEMQSFTWSQKSPFVFLYAWLLADFNTPLLYFA